MTNNHKMTNRLVVTILSLLMLFSAGPFFNADYTNIYAADASNITTWAELKEAIEIDKAESVTITENLYAESSINVTTPVTINGSGDNGVTIYQKERTTYDTMFKVNGNGDLTLGENLTLSGKTGTCSGGGSGSGNPTIILKMSGGDYDGRFLRINNDAILTHYTETYATSFELDPSGRIKYNGNYVGLGSGNTMECSSAITEAKALTLMTNGISFVLNGNANTNDEYGLGSDYSGTWKYAEYNEGALAFIETDSYNSSANGHFKVHSITPAAPAGQTCDGSDCPDATTYTASTFSGGTLDQPKGFFVDVNGANAKVTIDGATLSDFQTAKDVSNAAPIVVNQGIFTMNKGSISHNSVGYTAENDWLNKPANQIGKDAENGKYEDQGRLATWTKTETAGAVLLTNGANGTMNGGEISDNRADTGAIVVQGNPDKKGSTETYSGAPTKFTMNDGTISANAGVHHAGAVYVFNGARMDMIDGTISDNFAWNKGGAIWVSEEVYGSSKWDAPQGYCVPVGEATFYMQNGTLDNNMAIQRGGAIEVMSNHVALIGGKITNNKCRVLGGAIYVEGDGPQRNYRLYIKQGDITENSAVNPNQSDALKRGLTTDAPVCGKVNTFSNNSGGNIADKGPFNGHYGFGGGIWLCPFGGNAAIDVPDNNLENDVFVGNNSTNGDNKGKDIRVQPFRGGKVNGVNLIEQGNYNEFKNENNGSLLEDGHNYSGPLNLVNNKTTKVNDGVLISGNTAAAGGGIASNGTVMLGWPKDIVIGSAKLKVTKKWSGQIEEADRVPVTIKVFPKDENGNRIDQMIGEVKLNGIKDEQVDDITEENLPEDTYGPNASAFESEKWVGEFGIPLTATVNDKTIPLILLDVKGTKVDPSNAQQIEKLYKDIKDGSVTKDDITIKEWLVEVVEEKDGEEIEYKLPVGDVTLNAIDRTNEDSDSINDPNGNPIAEFFTATLDMTVANTIGNDSEHEIEKYVGEAIHKPISVDEVFKYDILAYVTMDADKVVITDQLVKDLEFALGEATILDIGEKINHKPNYDVNGNIVADNNGSVGIEEGDSIFVEGDSEAKATKVSGDGVEVTMEDGKLVVVLDNKVTVDEDAGTITREYDTVTKLRGHWVKVSFNAQIKSDLQERIKAGEAPEEVLTYAEIKAGETYKPDDSIYTDGNRPEPNVGNDPVVSDQDHKGVENTASYKIDVLNVAKYQDESNTVTVKPEESEVEKYVNQAVHKDIDLDEVFTYDIIGYITKDADKVVFEDELVSDLEFVDADEITVKYLDSNNHKPKNDINGKEINDDASVASEGWKDVDNDGLTINADQSSGKLTVTIDDLVETAPDGEVIDRERETVLKLRGKYVKVTFKARIKESIQDDIKAGKMTLADLSNVKVKADENDPVLSDEAHNGIVNEAKLSIYVGNEGKYNNLSSNKVTVKPEMPEIEKYVNQAVHKDIDLSEVFTYDIMAYVTKDADKVLITDELNEDLQFVSKDSEVVVSDMGAENNHKPTNNVKAKKVNSDATVNEKGTELKDANVKIDGNVLTVEIPDATSVRGNWVRVRFQCKIKDGKTVADLKYTTINPTDKEDRAAPNIGNAPVESKEQHNGVPNKASYTIGVKNEAGVIEDKYSDESNTVTVKPEDEKSSGTPKLIIKKTSDAENAKPGDEIPYTITLTNSGSADAKDVVITDTMDDNLTYISDDWDGINEGQTITWTVDVPAGMSLEINLLCRIDKDASGKVVNNVKLSNVKGEYVEVEKDNCEVVLPAYEGADTGDDTEMMPWMLLFIASVAAVTTGAVYRRKRSR